MSKQSHGQLIDGHGVSGYQALVILLCGAVALLDGFDTQAVAFVAPLVAKAWRLPASSFGLVFASGLLGGLAGGVLFGRLADRIGRRIAVLITVAVFALGSLLSISTQSTEELVACRLLTGLGLGGAMPSIIALAAEFAPARMRATLVTAMFSGFPLGAVIGAVASAPLIEAHGWRAVFWIGGIAPLVLLPVLAAWLPDSMEWLCKGGKVRSVERILRRLKRDELWDRGVDASAAAPAAGFSALFRGGQASGTLLLSVAFFTSLLLVYLLVSWFPTLATQSGHGARASVLTAAVLNLSGVCGSLLIGRAADRFGAAAVIALAYALGAIGSVAIAWQGAAGPLIFAYSIVAGLFCIGAQLSLVAVAAAFYPVQVRATGIGFLMAVGRVGAIAGPLAGATIIDGPNAEWILACVVGAFSVVSGLALLGTHRPRRAHAVSA